MVALRKIGFIIIVAFIFVYIVGEILHRGHRLFYAPFYEKLDEVFIGNTNYDVLLLGNSKVQFGMHPAVIDSVAKVNSYNIGYAAASFATMHLIFKSYLQNHKAPKQLVWCMQESMFFGTEDGSNQMLFYHYLYNNNIRNYMDSMQKPYYLPRFFSATKFLYFDDYNRVNVVTGFMHKSPFTSADMYNYKGYTISKNEKHGVQFNPLPKFIADTIHPQSLFYFQQIVSLCNSNNIKLIIIWPPNANQKTNNQQIVGSESLLEFVDSVCTQNKFALIRYDNSNTFKPNEFIDDSHLNYTGSLHYSALIGKLVDSFSKK
jgi:hypothetical protein